MGVKGWREECGWYVLKQLGFERRKDPSPVFVLQPVG
jgi:hypothetical protein